MSKASSSVITEDPARRAEIGLCVLLAAADGDVSEREIGALSSRLGTVFGDNFNPMALGLILDSELTKISELGPDRYVRTLVERLPEARRMRALRGALIVAYADGLAPEEESMFRDVAVALGIDTPTTESLLEEARTAAPGAPSSSSGGALSP